LNLQPQPGGKAWAPLKKPRRIRATYTRPHGVRHMLGAYDVTRDRLYGHVKKRKTRTEFLAFCRYIRSLYPAEVRLHFILDNFSPHLGDEVRDWAQDNNVELAYTPHYGSWHVRSRPTNASRSPSSEISSSPSTKSRTLPFCSAAETSSLKPSTCSGKSPRSPRARSVAPRPPRPPVAPPT
jgi:hypothetical protein